jgi:glycosyltransferase involved in cell wall biosynthesis
MTKIIIVIGGFMCEGGIERALINLLNILKPEKYQVDLLLFSKRGYHYNIIPEYINKLPLLWELDLYSDDLIERYKQAGCLEVAKIRSELHESGDDKREIAFSWDKIKNVLPTYEGYDIAISYNMGTPMRYVVDKVVAKKKIAWLHFDQSSVYAPAAQSIEMISDYVDRLDNIVCVTEQNKDSLVQKLPKVKNKVKVLPNINDVELMLSKAQEHYPVEFNEKVFNIFTASRISFDKGIDTLILAARLLKDKGINFIWTVAGQKCPGYEKYEKMIEDHNLQENVKLIGFITNPFPYYKFCDIYVQSSSYEGRCIAVEEAKILKCAIVVTNFPSSKDAIQNGVNGIICGKTPESLANAIKDILLNPEQRDNFKAVLSEHEYDNALEKYEKLFQL